MRAPTRAPAHAMDPFTPMAVAALPLVLVELAALAVLVPLGRVVLVLNPEGAVVERVPVGELFAPPAAALVPVGAEPPMGAVA